MGRHSIAYIQSHQDISPDKHTVYVGRVGLLAVALGIGAAVVGGIGTATADTGHSKDADHGTHATSGDPGKPKIVKTGKSDAAVRTKPARTADADTGSAAKTATIRVPAKDSTPTVAPAAAAAAATAAPPAPAARDQVPTQYGKIGKWMLRPFGQIANYGGQKYQGRTLLEPVNVIIVDPTSTNSTAAKQRLATAMTAGGFPARPIHSGGFKGIIDNKTYQQRPIGFLEAFSNNSYTQTNDHGRIFGPDPVQTSSGYVWTGAFSTEKVSGYFFGIPLHSYVSSNAARAALAAGLIASGQATYGGTVNLENAYNTGTITTGDHDGYAVILILNNPAVQEVSARKRISV